MSVQQLNQIEHMLTELIHSVSSLKTVFEEEREENQRRFEQIDRRFEQIDNSFQEIKHEFHEFKQLANVNTTEHRLMGARIFQNELDIERLKEAVFPK